MASYCKAQLGKQGLTENFLETLKSFFKNHQNVRISVLKSAGHDKQKIKEYTEKILEELGKNYTAKTIGFTIAVKKWRRPMR
jgi:RNA-binding protein YhbY